MGITIQDLLSGDIVKPRPQQDQNASAGLGQMLAFLSQGGQNQIASIPKQDNFMDSAFMQNLMKDNTDRRASAQLVTDSKGMLDEMISLETNPSRLAMLKQSRALLASGNPTLQKLAINDIASFESGIMPNYTQTTLQKNLSDPITYDFIKNKISREKVPVGTYMDKNGNLVDMPMASGGTYHSQRQQDRIDVRDHITPRESEMSEREGDRIAREIKKIESESLKYEESKRKDIPPAHRMVWGSNKSFIENIDKAIKQVEDNPDAFGFANILPEKMTQYTDPEGVEPRASVSAITQFKRHQTSGATVAPTEQPYLSPFLPSTSDTPEAIIGKLQRLKSTIATEQKVIEDLYSDPIFINKPFGTPPAPPAPPTATTPPAPPTATTPKIKELDTGDKPVGSTGILRSGIKFKVVGKNQIVEVK